MGLNLGDITFGLGADTTGLEKSVAKLQRFGTEVDKVARKQQQGSKTAVTALARQERAIKSALQQTLNLRQALKKAGAPPEELARTTNAFRRLTNTMTKGKVSVLQFTRAQDAFRASTGKTQRNLKKFNSSVQQGGKQALKFTDVMRNLESSAVLAVGPLSGVGARIRAIGAIAGRSNLKIIALFAGITALGVGFAKLAAGAVAAGRAMDKIEIRLTVATGSTIAANAEMQFIIKTVQRLGLNLESTAKQYALFAASTRGTNLEGEQTRKIFTSITIAARALSLSADDTAGTFKAITQIMSKGTVQAEELRGQMGERIPGAFRLAAKAMGVTTAALNKLLKDGKVLSDDFLPKLADTFIETFGTAAQQASFKLEASIERLSTATFIFNTKLNKTLGISTKFQKLVIGLTNSINFLTENMDKLVIAVGALAGIFLVLTGPAIITGIISLAIALKGVALGVSAINIAALIGPLGLLAGAVAGGAAAFLLFKKLAKSATEENEDFLKSVRKQVGLMEDLGTATKANTNTLIIEVGKRIKARRIDLMSATANAEKVAKLQQFGDIGFGKLFLGALKLFGQDIDSATKKVEGTKKAVNDLLVELERLKTQRAGLVLDIPIDPKALNAIANAAKSISRLRQQIDAMAISSKALKDLDKTFDIEDKVEKFKNILVRANVEQDKMNELITEFELLLPAYDKAAESLKKSEEQMKKFKKVGEDAFKSIEDGILGVIDGTKTMGEAFAATIDDMLKSLTRFFFQSAFQAQSNDIFASIFGALAGSVTGTTTGPPIPGIKPPVPTARAHGGPVSPGKSFTVGERGTEIFSPTSAGRIIPSSRLGGGTQVNITVINNSTGTETTIRESTKNNTRDIDIIIDDVVATKLNDPSSRTSKALRQNLSQQTVRR